MKCLVVVLALVISVPIFAQDIDCENPVTPEEINMCESLELTDMLDDLDDLTMSIDGNLEVEIAEARGDGDLLAVQNLEDEREALSESESSFDTYLVNQCWFESTVTTARMEQVWIFITCKKKLVRERLNQLSARYPDSVD